MDGNLRLRAAHWRSAGPHHPPRPHPGDERRLLPPQAKPPQTSLTSPSQTRLGGGEALPLRSSASPPPKYHFLILYWLPFTPPQWSTFTPPLTEMLQVANRFATLVSRRTGMQFDGLIPKNCHKFPFTLIPFQAGLLSLS